jgi:Transglutaminase-like superfamily
VECISKPHEPSRWSATVGMTDLETFAARVDAFPAEPAVLSRMVQSVLVHLDWLPAYGLNESDFPQISRETLPVAQRLRNVSALGADPIGAPRPPAERLPGTCRDFALMLVSFLRRKNIPARLRCGFASYFTDGWEDHWVCEYWHAETQVWRLADAQIDEGLQARLGIDFDPSDVPHDSFLTAGHTWLECRAGRFDFRDFGHGPTRGRWFAHVNVVRDNLALNDIVTSPWDRWRTALESQRWLNDDDVAATDALAEDPDRQQIEFSPEWLKP